MPAPLWVISALLVVLGALPSTASAKPKRPVHHAAHAHAAAAGPKRIAITSSAGGGPAEGPVRAQLARALTRAKIKVIPTKKGGAPGDNQQWVALGQKLKVDGFVQLSFEGGHGKQSVEESSVRNGADGGTLGSETFTAHGSPARLGAVVAKGFWKKLGASVKQTSAAKAGDTTGMPPRDLAHEETPAPAKPETPAEPETPPVAEKPVETPATPETKPEEPQKEQGAKAPPKPIAGPPPSEEKELGPREPAVTAVVQARYLHRSFVYTPSDAATSSTGSAPTVGGELMWFPITHFGLAVGGEFENWLKDLGKYPTVSSDLHASLVFRQPLSFGDLFVRAGGFRHFFAITDDGTTTRQNLTVPDVVYVGARAGAALSVHLTRALTATVQADYRLVTNMNGGTYPVTSQNYFPRATKGAAFDGGVTLAFRITPLLEIQAGGDIRRYVISTAGMAGDRINASGGTDTYLAGWVGLGGVYGGH